MAKFKVLKKYNDLDKDKTYVPNDEVDMTLKRADEIASKLGDGFLERLDVPPSKQKEEESE